MMSDIAFAIKFIVLLIALIAGFSVAIYASALVVAAFRKLCGHTGPKTEMSKTKNSQGFIDGYEHKDYDKYKAYPTTVTQDSLSYRNYDLKGI